MKVNEIKEGQVIVNSCFLINDVKKASGTNGVYLSLLLQDNTGLIEAKKWNATSEEINTFQKGEILEVIRASAKLFNNKVQISIEKGKIVEKTATNAANFIAESPISQDVLIKEFEFFKNSVKNEVLSKLLNQVFSKYYNDYINYPAASKNHHEFHCGLLYHSVGMAKLADEIAKLYNDVDRDLLITGCLLHDIGKVKELDGFIATGYTAEGLLLGHISIGANIVKEEADALGIGNEEEIMLLEHMILAHHGKLEFGSPVLPHTREALLLSMIDDLDAKMMILDKAYKDTKKGEFTEKIFPLDGLSYYKKK